MILVYYSSWVWNQDQTLTLWLYPRRKWKKSVSQIAKWTAVADAFDKDEFIIKQ